MNNVKVSAKTRARLSAAAEGLLADPELIAKAIAALEKVPEARARIERWLKRHARST